MDRAFRISGALLHDFVCFTWVRSPYVRTVAIKIKLHISLWIICIISKRQWKQLTTCHCTISYLIRDLYSFFRCAKRPFWELAYSDRPGSTILVTASTRISVSTCRPIYYHKICSVQDFVVLFHYWFYYLHIVLIKPFWKKATLAVVSKYARLL